MLFPFGLVGKKNPAIADGDGDGFHVSPGIVLPVLMGRMVWLGIPRPSQATTARLPDLCRLLAPLVGVQDCDSERDGSRARIRTSIT